MNLGLFRFSLGGRFRWLLGVKRRVEMAQSRTAYNSIILPPLPNRRWAPSGPIFVWIWTRFEPATRRSRKVHSEAGGSRPTLLSPEGARAIQPPLPGKLRRLYRGQASSRVDTAILTHRLARTLPVQLMAWMAAQPAAVLRIPIPDFAD